MNTSTTPQWPMATHPARSNTLPPILARPGAPSPPEIAAAESDRLLALTPCPCTSGSPALAQLQYGASSP